MTGTPTASAMPLSIEAITRHPRRAHDYDAAKHRYTDDYVNPSQYQLVINAFPGTDDVMTIPPEPGGPRKPVKIKRLRVPTDTVAFDFSIARVGRRFSKRTSHPVTLTGTFTTPSSIGPWVWRVSVPTEGTYEISVKYRNRSGGGPTKTTKWTLQDYLMVSIGDSAASGQGNPDIPGTPEGFEPDLDWWDVFVPSSVLFKITKEAFDKMSNVLKQKFTTAARKFDFKLDMDPDPVWLEANGYRSLRSGPAQAARSLEDRRRGRVVTFLSFARSGSEIRAGLIGPRTAGDGWIGNIGQIQEVRNTIGNRRIDALVISIGINDIGVSGTLKNLVANDLGGNDQAARDSLRRAAATSIAGFTDSFDALEEELKSLNIRHIYLTEYPTSLFEDKAGKVSRGCGIFTSDFDLDLDVDDAELLRDVGRDLNNALLDEASKRAWTYIGGIADDFRKCGYCTDEDIRLYVQAEESMIFQGDTEGTVHPNDAGHKIYAKHIAAAVKGRTMRGRKPLPGLGRPIEDLVPIVRGVSR